MSPRARRNNHRGRYRSVGPFADENNQRIRSNAAFVLIASVCGQLRDAALLISDFRWMLRA